MKAQDGFFYLTCWQNYFPGTRKGRTHLIIYFSAVAALALLYMDKVDMLGMFLGVVMMGMVALFLVVVLIMGLDPHE